VTSTFRPRHASPILAAILFAAGCGAESWTPPPPAGVTWQYEHQGFRERSTHVFAGSIAGPYGGMAYGGAFSFRHESELSGRAAADPFAESTPIDGYHFNEHLGEQGHRLSPIAAPAASTSGPAAPGSSSTPPTPSAAPVPTGGQSTW